jgi:hypothetical protein
MELNDTFWLFHGVYPSWAFHLFTYLTLFLAIWIAERIAERYWGTWYDRLSPAVAVMAFVGLHEVYDLLNSRGLPMKSFWDIIEAAGACAVGVVLITFGPKLWRVFKKHTE